MDAQQHYSRSEHSSEWYQEQLVTFQRRQSIAFSRKERIEELMQRRSSKKWEPEKTMQMTRRLQVVSNEHENASNAIEHITFELQKLTETK